MELIDFIDELGAGQRTERAYLFCILKNNKKYHEK